MATAVEKLGSRQSRRGGQPTQTRIYIVEDATTEEDASSAVFAAAPSTVDVLLLNGTTATLPRVDCNVDPIDSGGELYLGVVEYGYRTAGAVNTDTNPSTFAAAATQFTTVGQTEHIEFSKETIASYPADGETARIVDHGKAIGVTKNGIKGADIVVPKFEWTETYELSPTFVTDAYLLTLRRLTGTVNRQGWRGFDDREVLFMGATGRRERGGNWRVDFNFKMEKTVTDVEVGSPKVITITEKAGHDYVWFESDVTADNVAGGISTQPSCAYVERVYSEEDLYDLGIGS